jgi:carboxyl-terminal processing protease
MHKYVFAECKQVVCTQVVFHPPLLNKETKLVVLVNRGTASAAEIVSGAVQDHDRGIILGETTYGKGLVQQLQRLGQGGQQIKFTIGKYYTPSGRCIQSKAYTARNGQLGTDEVKVKDQDRKVFYTDSGRKVKDGGGIEPDVIKKDPTVGQLERELDRKDMFFSFADIYEAKHLVDGEQLASKQEQLATDEIYQDFQKFVMQKTNDVESPFDKSLDIMKTALEETGYTDALKEVDVLKTKLKLITKEEFNKDAASIRKRLDLALRQRFVPDSIVTSVSLYGDSQVDEAYQIAVDGSKYTSILGSKANQEVAAQSEAKSNIVAQVSIYLVCMSFRLVSLSFCLPACVTIDE